MYICICNAVTDKQIKAAVANGATTLADLQFDLDVATNCGRCMESALEFLPTPALCSMDAIEITRPVHGIAANDTSLKKPAAAAVL